MTDTHYDDSEGARGFTRIGVAAIAAVLAGVALWSLLVPVDEVIIAPGELSGATDRTVVRHPTGGLVSTIMVGEGDTVVEDQLLVSLNASTEVLSDDDLIEQQGALEAREMRLLAERDELSAEELETAFAATTDEPGSAITPEQAAQELELFATRRDSQASQSSSRSDRISRERQRSAGLNSQRQALAAQTDIVFQELLSAQELAARGLAPETRVQALQRESDALRSRDRELLERISEAEAAIASARLEDETAAQTLKEAVLSELAEVERDLAAVTTQRTTAADQLRGLEVRATRAGRVTGLGDLTVGDVIGPGEALFHVVPEGDGYSVLARLRPEDLSRITSGKPARVRLSPINGGAPLAIEGVVSAVASEPSANPATGQTYYVAEIDLPSEYERIGDGASRVLAPGMPAQIAIEVGEGRAYLLLLQPLADVF